MSLNRRAVSSHASREARALRRQPRHNQVGAAQRLMELNCALEVVAQQRVQPDVRAAALQPVVVQHFAQGRGVEVVVACELDALIADFGDLRQCVGQVAFAIVPH
jgi:hypothetical protein